jgi:cobalt/nickel transport system ATP-binding protein
VLVLDEPSSNLDPRARRELLRNLGDFPGTQLIATHDLDFVVAHCPRVLVLDGGRIRADGPTERLLRDVALMERHGLEVPLRLQLRHPG